MTQETLRFKVTPHILEDLGVNLYTSLSKALVEFVANAHDADADWAKISLDFDLIETEKDKAAAQYRSEVRAAERSGGAVPTPLDSRTLPADLTIAIEDNGHGMNRSDLEEKFLTVGRRRRKEEQTARTRGKQRIVMGRKGLGKLAGFGLAHRIEVVSRKQGEPSAFRIVLDLHALLGAKNTEEIRVPLTELADGGGLPETGGTRLVLSSLVYDALRANGPITIERALSEHFYFVNPADFSVLLNNLPVKRPAPDFEFAYPNVEGGGFDDLVERTYRPEDSPQEFTFSYRLRFRGPKKQLPAKERGVRIYAHSRLAAAPDLFEVRTSANGFQYTSYLDGVVVADFIDDAPTDYIATDRQTLRWETPFLSQMRTILTEEIVKALNAYDASKRTREKEIVEQDPFTKELIQEAMLPKHREKTAREIALTLAANEPDGVESDFYKTAMQNVVNGLGHGNILNAIFELARSDNAQLPDVVREITRLTRQEFDEFISIANGRLKGIEALGKICREADFREKKNEKPLHELFESNPWLLDPTFFEFLTSNRSQEALQVQLAKHLGVGTAAPTDYDPSADDEQQPLGANKRPDLVFLLSNEGLRRVVVVEFKAPNTLLHIDHLNQLERYMNRTEDWLKVKYKDSSYRVDGILVGSYKPDAQAEKVYDLNKRIEKEMGPNSPWKVYDVLEVLQRTEAAHRELVKTFREAAKAA